MLTRLPAEMYVRIASFLGLFGRFAVCKVFNEATKPVLERLRPSHEIEFNKWIHTKEFFVSFETLGQEKPEGAYMSCTKFIKTYTQDKRSLQTETREKVLALKCEQSHLDDQRTKRYKADNQENNTVAHQAYVYALRKAWCLYNI